MYNIFRLTGRYEEAAFIRELFDEPATLLYQVWSLIRTIDDALLPGSSITDEALVAQADQLIQRVIDILEGEIEEEVVRRLERLREALAFARRSAGVGTDRRGSSRRGQAGRQQLLP